MMTLIRPLLALTLALAIFSSLVAQNGESIVMHSKLSMLDIASEAIADLKRSFQDISIHRINAEKTHVDLELESESVSGNLRSQIETALERSAGIGSATARWSHPLPRLKIRITPATPESITQYAQRQVVNSTWDSSIIILGVAERLGLNDETTISASKWRPDRVRLDFSSWQSRSIPKIAALGEELESFVPHSKVISAQVSGIDLSKLSARSASMTIKTAVDAGGAPASCLPTLSATSQALTKLGKRFPHVTCHSIHVEGDRVRLVLNSSSMNREWLPETSLFLRSIPGLSGIELGTLRTDSKGAAVADIRLRFAAWEVESTLILRKLAAIHRVEIELVQCTSNSIQCNWTCANDHLPAFILALDQAKSQLGAAALEIDATGINPNGALSFRTTYRLP